MAHLNPRLKSALDLAVKDVDRARAQVQRVLEKYGEILTGHERTVALAAANVLTATGFRLLAFRDQKGG